MKFKTRTEARKHKALRTGKNINGTAVKPRISVFRSNKHFFVQFIDDTTGKTLVSMSSQSLKLSGANIENAKKVGAAAGAAAKAAGFETAVFDRNGYLYHGKIQAIADSIREAGIKF